MVDFCDIMIPILISWKLAITEKNRRRSGLTYLNLNYSHFSFLKAAVEKIDWDFNSAESVL